MAEGSLILNAPTSVRAIWGKNEGNNDYISHSIVIFA